MLVSIVPAHRGPQHRINSARDHDRPGPVSAFGRCQRGPASVSHSEDAVEHMPIRPMTDTPTCCKNTPIGARIARIVSGASRSPARSPWHHHGSTCGTLPPQHGTATHQGHRDRITDRCDRPHRPLDRSTIGLPHGDLWTATLCPYRSLKRDPGGPLSKVASYTMVPNAARPGGSLLRAVRNAPLIRPSPPPWC